MVSSISKSFRELDLKSTGLAADEPVFMGPRAPEAAPIGQPIKIWSNVFPVKLLDGGKKLYEYEVDVYMAKKEFTPNMDEKKIFAVTRTPFHGARATQGKEICGKIMEYIMKQEEVLPWNKIFYDHHRQLFATERIDQGDDIYCSLPLEELDDDPVFKPFTHGKVELVYKGEYDFSDQSINNLNGSEAGLTRGKLVGKFVEIAASKYCLDGMIKNRREPDESCAFLYLSGNRVYATRGPEMLPEAKELLLGLHKRVELVEGNEGRGHVGLGIAMDASKVCFLKPQLAIVTAQTVCGKSFEQPGITEEDVEKLNRVLKGAVVVARYSSIHQNMKIDRIIREDARGKQFTNEGRTLTVQEHFERNRREQLKYPCAPLAEVTRGGRQNHFPLEFLGIMPGNVVPTERQTAEIMAVIVKSSAMLPARRMDAILAQGDQQNIFGSKDDAGFSFQRTPYDVAARVLTAPNFVYGSQTANQGIDERGSWRVPLRAQFASTTMMMNKWAFFVVKDGRLNFDPTAFMKKLIAECRVKGLNVPEFTYCGMIASNDLVKTFENLVADKYDFALFSMDDSLKLQDELKYLERKYMVPTQNIRLSTVRDIAQQGKASTLANIVQKLNCKLGGLNHNLVRSGVQFNESLKKGEIFVLGIGDVVSLGNTTGVERDGTLPVVLSYAGTFSPIPNAFVGDFAVENMSLTDAKVYGAELFKKAFATLEQTGRKLPRNFIIYRSGTTGLDMKRIKDEEIREIRNFLRTKVGEEAQLLYIMVHKDHAVRFFKKDLNERDNASKQNIRPGTVVDTCVTHPHHRQFYLNAHVGLQGTAKTPRYTVLHDDTDATMDYLEVMTYDLCFMHQIVNLPTALPTPLRVAEEYGNRGKRILLQYWKDHERAADVSPQNLKQALEYKYAEQFKHRRINA